MIEIYIVFILELFSAAFGIIGHGCRNVAFCVELNKSKSCAHCSLWLRLLGHKLAGFERRCVGLWRASKDFILYYIIFIYIIFFLRMLL